MLDRPLSATESMAANIVCGTWQVTRKVIDHRAGAVYAFAGQAEITRELFEERGEMAVGKNLLQAVRTYRLGFEDTAVRVLYPSGNEFISLGFGATQHVSHLCGSDLYEGRFFFESEDSWVEVWRVNGPQKRYSSLSRYVRLT
ncbi:DUF6314 family protein [Phyllobacterium sp. SB3]|uniref:DUF6314 family protein n=1 Tax=Phyllobacterium sp. SB3 TaxID=3156073 RepID=UPI0032AFA423